MSHIKTSSVFFASFIISSSVFAAGLTVSSGGHVGNPLSQVAPTGNGQRLTSVMRSLRIRASCYGTNLRGVSNPVAPDSTITMSGIIKTKTASTPFKVTFPALAVLGGDTFNGAETQSITTTGFASGAVAGASGNIVSVTFPTSGVATLNPNTATITELGDEISISKDDISFEQTVPVNGGMYRANNGPITNVKGLHVQPSSDSSVFDVQASFPGQVGYCGGYFSPLMVFFDSEKPKFDVISNFDMKNNLKTYWPEANHPGYFLGLLNKDKKISSIDDLFGESQGLKNGFDKLAKLDLNRDGVIDQKDPIFKKLVLWKDSTGRGEFLSKDAIPLHLKVNSINLKYKQIFESVGQGAEYRERSTVEYKEGVKKQTAEIIDVWLKPVPRETATHLPE